MFLQVGLAQFQAPINSEARIENWAEWSCILKIVFSSRGLMEAVEGIRCGDRRTTALSSYKNVFILFEMPWPNPSESPLDQSLKKFRSQEGGNLGL